MSTQKTKPTEVEVKHFIETTLSDGSKQQDAFALLELMKSISGEDPKMWGPSIIGFGSYSYTYPSGHSGEAPLIGFSPRKAAFSLYVFTGLEEHTHLLDGLGKYTMGKACIYVKKLSDIDKKVLLSLMKHTIKHLKKTYGIS
ncbi:MAG: DUF1801 domain-containing protein [Candidatus Kapaibacteriota bacterium]